MKIKKAKKKVAKNPDKLVRANWYVLKYQMNTIKKIAKQQGISESEVVRNTINYLSFE